MTEGKIHSKVEPAITAALHQALRNRLGDRVRIPGVVDAVGRAFVIGNDRAARTVDNSDSIFLGRNVYDPEPDRRVHHILVYYHTIDIEPFTHNCRADIRFVLIVGAKYLDRTSEHATAEILDRHFDCQYRPRARNIGECAGHVSEPASAYRRAGALMRSCGPTNYSAEPQHHRNKIRFHRRTPSIT